MKRSFVVNPFTSSLTAIEPTMGFFYACLVLGTTLQLVTSQITPTITFISQKQIGNIGGAVNLQCSAKDAKDIPLVWAKVGNDTLYISSGKSLIVPDNRYTLTHNETSWTFTLKIQHLQLEDAGLYQCILVKAPDNLLTANLELEIRQTETSIKN